MSSKEMKHIKKKQEALEIKLDEMLLFKEYERGLRDVQNNNNKGIGDIESESEQYHRMERQRDKFVFELLEEVKRLKEQNVLFKKEIKKIGDDMKEMRRDYERGRKDMIRKSERKYKKLKKKVGFIGKIVRYICIGICPECIFCNMSLQDIEKELRGIIKKRMGKENSIACLDYQGRGKI